jgi:hypothetical protein
MNIDYERLTRILIRISALMLILSMASRIISMGFTLISIDSDVAAKAWIYSVSDFIYLTFGILLLAKSRQIATSLSK